MLHGCCVMLSKRVCTGGTHIFVVEEQHVGVVLVLEPHHRVLCVCVCVSKCVCVCVCVCV
jgi:hypothetical protein